MHVIELVDGGERVEKAVPKEGGKEGGMMQRVFRREASSFGVRSGWEEDEETEEEMKKEEAAAVIEDHVM